MVSRTSSIWHMSSEILRQKKYLGSTSGETAGKYKRGNDAVDEIVHITISINTGWILGKDGLGSPNQPFEFLTKEKLCKSLK